ncbi:hypothetical protein Q7P35_005468 [Cladosporium inversicolor]
MRTPPSRLFSAKKGASDPSKIPKGRRRRERFIKVVCRRLELLVRSVTPLGSIELVPGDVGWRRTRDPNVSTPGYTRIGLISYLAKVSEDSGARPTSVDWRHVTRSLWCAEKRARWNSHTSHRAVLRARQAVAAD